MHRQGMEFTHPSSWSDGEQKGGFHGKLFEVSTPKRFEGGTRTMSKSQGGTARPAVHTESRWAPRRNWEMSTQPSVLSADVHCLDCCHQPLQCYSGLLCLKLGLQEPQDLLSRGQIRGHLVRHTPGGKHLPTVWIGSPRGWSPGMLDRRQAPVTLRPGACPSQGPGHQPEPLWKGMEQGSVRLGEQVPPVQELPRQPVQ